MYSLDLHRLRGLRGGRWSGIGANVFFLGLTSMLTDISSEMVTSILPVYMAFALGLTPLQLGFVDGIYQGGSALARLASGWVADRWRRDREVAASGYAVSCACKLGLMAAGSSWPALSAVVALDRLGKGVRTSPRDALISLASAPGRLGLAFGIHRAFDTLGALLGPLLAFAILWLLSDAYDVVFVTSFFIALVAVAVLLMFVRNAPRGDPAATRAATSTIAMAALLRERRFRGVLVAGTALGLVTLADSFFYLVLQRRATIDPASFPLLYAATAVAYLALAIPAGRLGDGIGRGKVFLLGHVVLVFRNASPDQTHGRVGLRFIDAPDGERYLTPLSCERVHLGAGRGVCLQAVRGMLTSYHARIFDRRFHIEHSQALTGPPSRARISPDGRLAAITVFENGHSYASAQFSTRTSILDTATGQWVVDDLEKWDVLRGGKPFKAADFNYWGITFGRDGRRFYATLHTAGRFHLVEGDLATRSMRVVHDDVECPSLSPDNTRVAFKRRVPTGAAGRFAWRLVVLNLASGRETPLAGETRSVDDQVEWLDNEDIAYALPDRDDESTAAMNIWALGTSGTATPRLLVPMASSPAAALARSARPAP